MQAEKTLLAIKKLLSDCEEKRDIEMKNNVI